MSIIVQKYGGSSVATIERMENVARRIISAKEAGHKVVVVLSARGDTTDDLLKLANEANPNGSNRERDMLLSVGEQISVAMMAMILQRMGHGAKSLTARQAGIMSTSEYSNARITNIDTPRIIMELDAGNIVLIAGFQGETAHGDVATLGRGASDTTAVALAAVLNAKRCEIYTDVEGVYSADPRIVPNALKLPEISYFEMLEMAASGAKVLASRSVGLARKYGVQIVVLSSMAEAEGTVIKEEAKVEGIFVSGVVSNKNIARFSLSGVKDAPGVWFKMFSVMNKKDIAIDFVYQRKLADGTKDISFTVETERLQDTKSVLEENVHVLNFLGYKVNENVAKLSVVSSGMATNPGIPAMMCEALFDAGINIDSLSTSETRISAIIDKKDIDKGTQVVHDKFFGVMP
ncbi:MAG: aspartate kinase [Defluviitaleaceae bacterium]|nr:aspartate kinase [Defluviitaleaceae bacterium]